MDFGLSICFTFFFIILTIIALIKASSAGSKIASLEREIKIFREEIKELQKLFNQGLPSSPPVKTEAPVQKPQPQAQAASAPVVSPIVDLRTSQNVNVAQEVHQEVKSESSSQANLPLPKNLPPPPPPPIPKAAPAPPPPPRKKIEWERWIGVRGAALLGGIVLVIAAFLFFQYAVENEYIKFTPIVRVALGTLAGLFFLIFSEFLRKRKFDQVPNALSGAGIVALYTSFWAAKSIYELITFPMAFVLMLMVTLSCALLCQRYKSLFVAVLGLVGGFLTPLVLSSGSDNPIGLFGYVLLLDLAFLWVAQKQKWTVISNLALVLTFVIQAMYIFGKMGPDRLPLILGVLILFAAVFAFYHFKNSDSKEGNLFQQGFSILVPFVFALYFASNAQMGLHLYPIAAFMIVMNLLAIWIVRQQGHGFLLSSASFATMLVFSIWLSTQTLNSAKAWELMGSLLAYSSLWYFSPKMIGDAKLSASGSLVTLLFSMLLLIFVIGNVHAGLSILPVGMLSLLFGFMIRRVAYQSNKVWAWAAAAGLTFLIFLVALVVRWDQGFSLFEFIGFMALFALSFLPSAGKLEALEIPLASLIGLQAPFLFVWILGLKPGLFEYYYPLGLLQLLLLGLNLHSNKRYAKAPLSLLTAINLIISFALWFYAGRLAHFSLTEIPLAHYPLFLEGLSFFVLYALVLQIFSEIFSSIKSLKTGALTYSIASLVLAELFFQEQKLFFWTWMLCWSFYALLLFRQAHVFDKKYFNLIGAVILSYGFTSVQTLLLGPVTEAMPALHSFWLFVFFWMLLYQGFALKWPNVFNEHAAAAFAIVQMILFALGEFSDKNLLESMGMLSLYAFMVVLAASRLPAGLWYGAAMILTLLSHVLLMLDVKIPELYEKMFFIELAAVCFFTLWPFLFKKRFLQDKWIWLFSALAAPLWFIPLKHLFIHQWGDAFIAVLPVGLAVLSLFSARQISQMSFATSSREKNYLVLFLAITLSFVSVAIPLQLKNEWWTIGWAIEGFMMLLLWKKLDHVGLKYYALLLLAAVTVRLVCNSEVLLYHERGGLRILNWILYTYWVPALALIGSGQILIKLEREWARAWEAALYQKGWNFWGMLCSAASILVIFYWINLAIADWFGTTSFLSIQFEKNQARDLATSIAWGLYALILLGIGMYRVSKGLRWVSLVMLMITIGKVFLYDLSGLKDLYRVMSLLGLAFSLIIVSLAYQKFVFKKDDVGVTRFPSP
ncbi:MAG: DUF2339 domain-containing protein [Deltaproteobacteria bacterium]|nr:DUF2339 domain-containing protein [Deltaproteobacteria bacterium]